MRNTGPDMDTVMAVLHRDGYRCIRDGVPIQGERGLDWVLHHRRPRAMGGTRRADANSPANLVSLCAPCHGHIESHREEATARGFNVPQGVDPRYVPINLATYGWVLLDDEGFHHASE